MRTGATARNQKTCYEAALSRGADIVVMLHPDYQYTPLLVTAMASMIAYDQYDCVLASRILGNGALKGGMPLYKYISNRFLTLIQNLLIGQKLSEYHTGYRAWSRAVIERLPLLCCSDDFVFDNQIIVQAVYFGFRIGEISCPTKYFDDASSINFKRSVVYGVGVLTTALQFLLEKMEAGASGVPRRQGSMPPSTTRALVEAEPMKLYVCARDVKPDQLPASPECSPLPPGSGKSLSLSFTSVLEVRWPSWPVMDGWLVVARGDSSSTTPLCSSLS